ncbi:MAG: hypothetical protein LIP04_08000 [Tannerellaceae bacterium]|nr:hypothetical protein [Tannerellaceae bacterium]
METYLALDLGGTKLLIGEMDRHGNILKYKKYDTGYFNQPAALEFIKKIAGRLYCHRRLGR